jgi:hypothetical protein
MKSSYKKLALFAAVVAMTTVMVTTDAKTTGSGSVSGAGFEGIPTELENVIYDQITGLGCETLANGCLFSDDCTGASAPSTGIVADDFVVPDGETWTLDGLAVEGAWTAGAVGALTAANWFIYDDAGGVPGSIVCDLSGSTVNPATSDQFVQIGFTDCPALDPGTYWLAFNPSVDCALGIWCWVGNTSTNGSIAHVLDVGFCGPDWVPQGPDCNENVTGVFLQDLCFAISATIPEPPTVVPAVSTVGIVVLLLLMMAASFYFLMRRRTA